MLISSVAVNNKKQVFPIENYNQDVDYWINPANADYNYPILESKNQAVQFNNFKHHYFGTDISDPSPWNMAYVTQIIKGTATLSISNSESEFLDNFDNSKITDKSKIWFGMNQRPIPNKWIAQIRRNLDWEQLKQITPQNSNRAIMVENSLMRILPTHDPVFYSDNIAGEGYPFDKLENSVIYVGTPVYIIARSKDHKWDLVLSPSLISWVPDNMVAHVDDKFISKYQAAAYNNLVGITNNNVSIMSPSDVYLLTGYVGVFLPLLTNTSGIIKMLLPIRVNGLAEIRTAEIESAAGVQLPLPLTKANFASVLKIMQARPYGWGNFNMYNDCSAEMKSIFTLFGIFIPRNTASIDHAGNVVDVSVLDLKSRVNYLLKNGLPLLTLIHVKGHVVLYIGDYENNIGGVKEHYPLSYQQVWGLRPVDNSYRSIIGQSVFLPLWSNYPENNQLRTMLSASMFKLIYLNSTKLYTPELQDLLY